jgi:hypothetical protein
MVVDSISHSGFYSMKVKPNNSFYITRCLTEKNYVRSDDMSAPYHIQNADLLGLFAPNLNEERKYVLSFWVRGGQVSNVCTNYTDIETSITITGNPSLSSTLKKSPIIDGWQQYEYEFTIPSVSVGTINITMRNQNLNNPAYFDDVRIFPSSSNIKTFVYNYKNYRFLAELDANNYATFYEYNEEGMLIRVKKETERGIYTIKQSINHQFPKQIPLN